LQAQNLCYGEVVPGLCNANTENKLRKRRELTANVKSWNYCYKKAKVQTIFQKDQKKGHTYSVTGARPIIQ
jgi:hypothetical protein